MEQSNCFLRFFLHRSINDLSIFFIIAQIVVVGTINCAQGFQSGNTVRCASCLFFYCKKCRFHFINGLRNFIYTGIFQDIFSPGKNIIVTGKGPRCWQRIILSVYIYITEGTFSKILNHPVIIFRRIFFDGIYRNFCQYALIHIFSVVCEGNRPDQLRNISGSNP